MCGHNCITKKICWISRYLSIGHYFSADEAVVFEETFVLHFRVVRFDFVFALKIAFLLDEAPLSLLLSSPESSRVNV